MSDRRCENCGGAIPARMSRQRHKDGGLVCDSCINLALPQWTAGLRYSESMGGNAEMRRRVAESISSIARVLRRRNAGLSVVAHDSGDNAIINHCPFCGSGGVIGGGDGTVSCQFCHSNFTVQVQPAHPFMPQTVDGQPVPPAGLPGDEPTEMSAPLDPAVNETSEGVVEDPSMEGSPTPFNGPPNPGGPPAGPPEKAKGKVPPQFAKGSSFRTAEGAVLDEEAYMARLALSFADDREQVLDAVRARHVAASTITCWHCEGSGDEPSDPGTKCEVCDGTGLVDVKVAKMSALAAVTIKASEIMAGDRLDRSGKTRVVQRHPRTDKVLVKTQTNGARSPSVASWGNDDDVTVYRDTSKQAAAGQFVLRHKTSGRYYATMNLGADVMTDNPESARKFTSRESAQTFTQRFGDRYEVVETGAKQADLLAPQTGIDVNDFDLLALNPETDWDEDLLRHRIEDGLLS